MLGTVWNWNADGLMVTMSCWEQLHANMVSMQGQCRRIVEKGCCGVESDTSILVRTRTYGLAVPDHFKLRSPSLPRPCRLPLY